MDVSLDSQDAKQGEPLTIRTRIYGNGNFRTVNPPAFVDSDLFNFYEPKLIQKRIDSNSKEQEKIYDLTIIPKEVVEKLPELRFSYFDPSQEKYYTLTKTLQVQVSKIDNKDNYVYVYLEGDKKNLSTLFERVLIKIENTFHQLYKFGRILYVKLINYTPFFIFIAIACICLIIIYRKKNRTRNQKHHIMFVNYTYKNLKDTREFIDRGDFDGFYDFIHSIIQSYFKEMFQIIFTGVSDYEVQILRKSGLTDSLILRIRDFYLELDSIRFSKIAKTKDDMDMILSKTYSIINEIENESNLRND